MNKNQITESATDFRAIGGIGLVFDCRNTVNDIVHFFFASGIMRLIKNLLFFFLCHCAISIHSHNRAVNPFHIIACASPRQK